jgi:glycosyltransferase involved in cell wall biosynthesis
MAARDFRFETLILVSTKFGARDTSRIWASELEQIRLQAGTRIEYFTDHWEAHRHLRGCGLLFSASESNLEQHATTYDLFRHAPPTFLRVTLQHGFECVGFRHSRDHVRAHGRQASFGADIVCGWSAADQLQSLPASQRGKLLVTGPTSVLQMASGAVVRSKCAPGLVCENLHSVRFKGASDLRPAFLNTFGQFARFMESRERTVVLRTHPGGQYALRNKLPLRANVTLENAPIYRLDLRFFSYGISAPSSVLIDMLLAGIPTAVWRDPRGEMDTTSYDGLETVCSAREWADFAAAAEADPRPFVRSQQQFIERSGMPIEPREVFSRFAQLFEAGRRMEVRSAGSVAERERILFIANGNVPTLQLSFIKALAPLIERGEIASRILTEKQLRSEPGLLGDADRESEWMKSYLDYYNPSLIVFCRYSGPAYQPVLDWAECQQVPVIYHVDDDLLAVPSDIGQRKFAIHNAPSRLTAVTSLLNSADLVYASTERLKERLLGYFPDLPIVAGAIYCSASVLRRPEIRAGCTVGYMASADHAHNLEMVLPAIERLLDTNPDVRFELFGSIPLPEQLQRFENRVVTEPSVEDYDRFLETFVAREWDIGICPLTAISFNMMKANTKWVEYTAAGAAVVASSGTVYDDCCAGGCGFLACGTDEWLSALDLLVNNVEERLKTVERAQAKLEQDFGTDRLREQVLNIIARAHAAVAVSGRSATKQKARVCQLP